VANEPFAGVDVSGSTPELVRVIETSREQFRAYGRADAKILWVARPAFCRTDMFGSKGWASVMLSATDDGMLYCNILQRRAGRSRHQGLSFGDRVKELASGLVWCVYIRPPNTCRVNNGTFWLTRIDKKEEVAKSGPRYLFMATFRNPKELHEPFVGLVTIYKGRKLANEFKAHLTEMGAEFN
jgi:hypothetical protein